MTVFVPGGYDGEGGVFSTLELAVAHATATDKFRHGIDFNSIVEWEIDDSEYYVATYTITGKLSTKKVEPGTGDNGGDYINLLSVDEYHAEMKKVYPNRYERMK